MKSPSEVAQWIKSERIATRAAAAAVWEGGVELGGEVDCLFDLASLTKPVLALSVLRSGIDARAPVGTFLREIAGTETAEVPLELLLAHRAGLAAHAPLYEPLTRGEAMDPSAALVTAAQARRACARLTPPEEGWEPLYSDLGYVLAGAALARATGAIDAGDAMRALALEPLGIELGAARDFESSREVAPTEDVPWRGGVIVGRVHDENAWALTGRGASGHAGLFGGIEAVSLLARHFLTSDLGWMVRERPGGTLRAGFDGKSAAGSSAGVVLGARTFGHLGFTGTSMWMDPDARIAVVLLTNRVHPTRASDAIRAARPIAHDALARFALARG